MASRIALDTAENGRKNRFLSQIVRIVNFVVGDHRGKTRSSQKLSDIDLVGRNIFRNSKTGIELMPDIVNADRFEKKLRIGIAVPSGLVPERMYLLKWNERIEVWEHDRHVGHLCVLPRELDTAKHTVAVDTYRAFYINLVLREEGFLKVANLYRKPVHYQV